MSPVRDTGPDFFDSGFSHANNERGLNQYEAVSRTFGFISTILCRVSRKIDVIGAKIDFCTVKSPDFGFRPKSRKEPKRDSGAKSGTG